MSSNDKQDKSDTPRMDATLGKGSDWVFAEGCRLERELAESRQMHAELQREIEKMAANTFRSHAAPVAADPQPLPGTACKAIYDEAIAVAQREKPLGSSADWISTALVHVYAAGQRSITRSATAPRSDVYALVDAVATMFSKHPGEMTNWPEWDAVSLAFHKLPEAHVEIVAAESRSKE
jgi:hypothetical protein